MFSRHSHLVSSMHSPSLIQIVDVKPSQQIYNYVVDCVADAIDLILGQQPIISPRAREARRIQELNEFTAFVSIVLIRAQVTTPVILALLVYIDEVKANPQQLRSVLRNKFAIYERIFLGALILASKYLDDDAMNKNTEWAACIPYFGAEDISLIEDDFLTALQWNLTIREQDIWGHFAGILGVYAPPRGTCDRSPHDNSPAELLSPLDVLCRSLESEFSNTASHVDCSDSPESHHTTMAAVPDDCPGFESSSPLSSESSSSPRTPANVSTAIVTDPKAHLRSKSDALKSYPIPSNSSSTLISNSSGQIPACQSTQNPSVLRIRKWMKYINDNIHSRQHHDTQKIPMKV
ncbi:hypothetical protein F5890DRAFT_1407685 [Lentinula detonsa]|uniref:Cyclin N-terminal domain-containing protein n=1 Tax=Lentinula detonsa TaxID=2804962 RepID=A0AA38UTS5_9AGAR|nr:hypothetical protein F5890DRAFT_1407685 [Lentinula detonsa]